MMILMLMISQIAQTHGETNKEEGFMTKIEEQIMDVYITILVWCMAIIVASSPLIISLCLSIILSDWYCMLANLIYLFIAPLIIFMFKTLMEKDYE